MDKPDQGLKNLGVIISEFATFCKDRGGVSEADTRAKVVDRVLKEVLFWPETPHLTREDHVDSGFIDYTLHLHGQPYLAVEAKKQAAAFVLPNKMDKRRYTLNGALIRSSPVKNAIEQVRQYCDDSEVPIKYAIATNGYTWIVFRAIREDVGWRTGTARVFQSLEDIQREFTEFWNLLSFDPINAGALQEEFSSTGVVSRKMLRVIDKLYNADVALRRNRLNTALQPIITLIFEDIADQDQVELLEECYVHTGSLKIVQNDLDHIITESIPQFLAQEGTKSVGKADTKAGFEDSVAGSFATNKGRLFLLLGGIGSGKSTFLKRYQRTNGRELLDKKSLWFAVDFLKAPGNVDEMESFVWQSVLDDIRKKYKDRNYEQMKHLRTIFEDKIHVLQSNVLSGLKQNSDKYGRVLGPYLLDWQGDLVNYVPRLLQESCRQDKIKPLLFVDQVDQLSPAYQGQVFLLAQRLTRVLESITIVSLREESYYTASIQKKFTAFTNHKFHIASPRFRLMIQSRIRYAVQLLHERSAEGGDDNADSKAISDFLLIVRDSIFGTNKHIVRFIEAICYGNMRFALQMFTNFLTSGATDVDKMLRIYERDGRYHVAYHEFVKSVMLAERRTYKEDESPIVNMFNVGGEKNSSHFTAWRVIDLLYARRGESTPEGRGYVPLSEVISAFESVFNSRGDILLTLDRLIRGQLVQANTHSTEKLEGATHVRVTSAGVYYILVLAKSFAYLDLVLQDTPFNDEEVEAFLRQSCFHVDNLADREDLKLERVHRRFERVDVYLKYLQAEELRERKEFNLDRFANVFSRPIMATIAKHFERDKEWIDHRIRENRERYEDDSPVGDAEIGGEPYEGEEEPIYDEESAAESEPKQP